MSSYRYMTISDEWDIPEKQPFKDLVSYSSAGNGNMLHTLGAKLAAPCVSLSIPLVSLAKLPSLCLGSSNRGICGTGWRRLSAETSTV